MVWMSDSWSVFNGCVNGVAARTPPIAHSFSTFQRRKHARKLLEMASNVDKSRISYLMYTYTNNIDIISHSPYRMKVSWLASAFYLLFFVSLLLLKYRVTCMLRVYVQCTLFVHISLRMGKYHCLGNEKKNKKTETFTLAIYIDMKQGCFSSRSWPRTFCCSHFFFHYSLHLSFMAWFINLMKVRLFFVSVLQWISASSYIICVYAIQQDST